MVNYGNLFLSMISFRFFFVLLRHDSLYQERRDMECCVAWRGYPDRCRVRHHLPGMVFSDRQQLGAGRGDSLSLRYVGLVCSLDVIPLNEAPFEMEGAFAQVGSCGDLLAYRGVVFAVDTDRAAGSRLLGLESLFICLGPCHRGDNREFYPLEGALESGDILFRGHGIEYPRGV